MSTKGRRALQTTHVLQSGMRLVLKQNAGGVGVGVRGAAGVQ